MQASEIPVPCVCNLSAVSLLEKASLELEDEIHLPASIFKHLLAVAFGVKHCTAKWIEGEQRALFLVKIWIRSYALPPPHLYLQQGKRTSNESSLEIFLDKFVGEKEEKLLRLDIMRSRTIHWIELDA